MANSFYTRDELEGLGLKNVGTHVYISSKCSIYGAENISIGSYVRIDDFCILSGCIEIGSYVHIAAYNALYGGKQGGIILKDFVTLSSRNAIYSMTDDYYGDGLSNPLFDDRFRKVHAEKVIFEKHALIGSGCTILPGAHVLEGTSIGAMSMIKREVGPWGVFVGNPLRRIGERSKKLLEYEKECILNSVKE